MSRLVFINFPEPDPGQHWCAQCVLDYKWELVTNPQVEERIKEALSDGNDKNAVAIVAPKGWVSPPLFPAVAVLPCPLYNYQLLELCWTHATAMAPPNQADAEAEEPTTRGHDGASQIIPATGMGDLPPGFGPPRRRR